MNSQALRVADDAIAGVRERGDAFVAGQIAKYDGAVISPGKIAMTPSATPVEEPLKGAIETAIRRVESFHRQQLPSGYTWRHADTTIEHRVLPLKRVGIYVPGGRAVYLSTLIMCAVPARIAGVHSLVVATTSAAASRPELQYACARLGVETIYRAGGAAGVAALGIGTNTLRRVDKIVGPGNSFVTAAKARLVGEVGIDMTAGPTELVVIADDTADAEIIAADLRAQAEHGPDSAVICISTSLRVAAEVSRLCPAANVVCAPPDEVIARVNEVAPEHVAIHAVSPEAIAERIENAGTIFCGPVSAPAAGDYVFGSNHVLPTARTARFFSPLGVYDFVKRTNVVTAGERDFEEVADAAVTLAELEGMALHAQSISARQKVRR